MTVYSCRPPLRGFLLDGDFFVAASLATTLTKIALRYVSLVQEKKKQNVSHLCAFTVVAKRSWLVGWGFFCLLVGFAFFFLFNGFLSRYKID